MSLLSVSGLPQDPLPDVRKDADRQLKQCRMTLARDAVEAVAPTERKRQPRYCHRFQKFRTSCPPFLLIFEGTVHSLYSSF